jgi:hypothetical protein
MSVSLERRSFLVIDELKKILVELMAVFLLVYIIVVWWKEYVRATALARSQAMVAANNTLQQPAMRALQIQNPASTRPSLHIAIADAGSVRSGILRCFQRLQSLTRQPLDRSTRQIFLAHRI